MTQICIYMFVTQMCVYMFVTQMCIYMFVTQYVYTRLRTCVHMCVCI